VVHVPPLNSTNGSVLRLFLLLALIGAAWVASPARAQFATSHVLTLDGAQQAAAAARAVAVANGWNVAIAVVDAAGGLIYFKRLEGTQPASVDIAIGKARTAAAFKRSTKVFEDGIGSGRTTLLSLDIVPFEGGLPIVVDGEVVGAIGVSGVTPEQDGIIAQAGIRAILPGSAGD
jgi:glc operon protein GlcG